MSIPFSLSTRWNASRHTDGEPMIEEALRLGITRVELGYDLTFDLVPGVRRMVDAKAIVVDSVHSYCPVPVGAPMGHPELFSLVSTNARERESAITHTARTIQFAHEMGAKVVVAHAGHADTRVRSRDLSAVIEEDGMYSPAYEKMKLKLMMARDKVVQKHLELMARSIESLLPELQGTGVRLALEITPAWESLPCELEMDHLARRFDSPHVRYWHDIGHGQIRQNYGFINHLRWAERLLPWMAGIHIHDAAAPDFDHLMPPHGAIDFRRLRFLANRDMLYVLEPGTRVTAEELREGMRIIEEAWMPDGSSTAPAGAEGAK